MTRATVLVGLLGSVGVATFFILGASSDVGGDPFDSPFYSWSWVALPVLAGLAAIANPATRPIVWAAALHLPLMVGVAYLGTFGHDPNDGASLWMAGEVFLVVQAALAIGVAALARTQRVRMMHGTHPSSPPPQPRA